MDCSAPLHVLDVPHGVAAVHLERVFCGMENEKYVRMEV